MDRNDLGNYTDRLAGELRQHLNQVAAAGEMLEPCAAGTRERDCLAVLRQGVCRMLRVVRRMELLHRLTDENEIRFYLHPLDWRPWMDELAQRAGDLMKMLGVDFRYAFSGESSGCGDRELLEHMMFELLGAGVRPGGHMQLTAAGENGKIRISVSSDGPDPRPVSPSDPGLGAIAKEDCGLAIARHVAELHGGALVVGSAPGKGSTAVVELPLDQSPSDLRLESPWTPWDANGFDPFLVAFSDRLPKEAFLPRE